MLIKIADPVIELVEAPKLYNTPIDVVDSLDAAKRVVEMLQFLKEWDQLKPLLTLDAEDVVLPVFEKMVRHYLVYFKPDDAHTWARYLLNHVYRYDDFLASKPSYSVKSLGKKYRANGGSMLFDTQQQAVNFHIQNLLSCGKYEIVEGV